MNFVWLFLVCAQLSLVAIGGAQAIIPELQRQTVVVHGWMSAPEFGALFAIGQAAPGPNVLVCTLVGWQVAGFGGAAAATLGILVPSSVLAWFVEGAWDRFRDRPWRRAVQAGLVPVTVGLVMAAAGLLAVATAEGAGPGVGEWVAAGLTVGVAVATVRTKLHPLVLLGAGAVVGMVGLV